MEHRSAVSGACGSVLAWVRGKAPLLVEIHRRVPVGSPGYLAPWGRYLAGDRHTDSVDRDVQAVEYTQDCQYLLLATCGTHGRVPCGSLLRIGDNNYEYHPLS